MPAKSIKRTIWSFLFQDRTLPTIHTHPVLKEADEASLDAMCRLQTRRPEGPSQSLSVRQQCARALVARYFLNPAPARGGQTLRVWHADGRIRETSRTSAGWTLNQIRSRTHKRIEVLVLIAAIASLVQQSVQSHICRQIPRSGARGT